MVWPVETAVEDAEEAPCDPVVAADDELPMHEVEVPAWIVTGAEPIVVPVESVMPRVTAVPDARLTLQVRVVASVSVTKVSKGVAPS